MQIQSHCVSHLLSHLYPLRVALLDDGPLVVVLFELQQFVDAPVEFKHPVQYEPAVPLRWAGHGQVRRDGTELRNDSGWDI